MTQDLSALLDRLRRGGMIVLTGDRLRGGDIDFAVAAEHATPERINFMAKFGRGLICLGLTPAHARRLGIDFLNPTPERQSGRPFAVSIEARRGVSTGISAADRAHTIATAIAPDAGPDDITTPGHIFPLIVRPDGVLERPGAVEAAVDLMGLAGLQPAAVLCAVMKDDGTMARATDAAGLAAQHGLDVVALEDIVALRQLRARGAS